MVFITIRNPQGREVRYVAPVTSPQELIEFHCPGKHEVSGMVVFGSGVKEASTFFLKKYSRRAYEHKTEYVLRSCECTALGNAELSVEVPDGFFAPELSPKEDWYVNLWFGEPAWDECEIRRRRLIAYTIQTALLAIYVPALCTIRFIFACYAAVLCLRKDVPWSVVVHPFSDRTSRIWDLSSERFYNQPIKSMLLVPMHQFIIIAGAIFAGSLVQSPMLVLVAYISILAFGVGLNLSVPVSWKQYISEREKHYSLEQLNAAYSDLLCTTAPIDGTLRTKRHGFKNNVVLAFHDFKARVCRPTASK